MLESVSAVEKEPQARATHVDTSFQTDSGTDADIDDVDPVPISFGRNRIKHHLTDERSEFRRSLLRLLEDEVESWEEEDALLRGIIASLMNGRRRGRKEIKEISLRLLELEKLNAT